MEQVPCTIKGKACARLLNCFSHSQPARCPVPACTLAYFVHDVQPSLGPSLTLAPQGITNGAVLTAVRRVLVADGWKVRCAALCCTLLCCAVLCCAALCSTSDHSAPPPPCSAHRCNLLRPAPPTTAQQIQPVDDDGYASTSDEEEEEGEDAWEQKFDVE